MSYWVSKANLMCGWTPLHGICYKWKDVNGTMGNVSTNNSKHIVMSRQPLAALEPAKPLTHSFYCAQLWLRETKTVWVVQRHERAKAERRGTGCGEQQCVLCGEQQYVLCSERQCVLCVDQWYSDRAKVERSSASGARYWVRAAPGPNRKKRRNNNRLICEKLILRLLVKRCLFITDYFLSVGLINIASVNPKAVSVTIYFIFHSWD